MVLVLVHVWEFVFELDVRVVNRVERRAYASIH